MSYQLENLGRSRALALVAIPVRLCLILLVLGGCGGEKQGKAAAGTEASTKSAPPPRHLVIASYGGAYQDAQREAMFKPFASQHGVKIVEDSHTGDLGKIEAMVKSGSIAWDIADVETSLMLRGARAGLFEPIDRSSLPVAELEPSSLNDYGVGVVYWSTVLAFNTRVFPEGRPRPRSWREFWDTQRFPGPRSLRNTPRSTLEFALLADGVEMANLYPLDVDRAFRSLGRIRPFVQLWWDAGSQPPQALAAGSVVLASSFSGRIDAARKAGNPVAFNWPQGLVDLDWWVIPKGTKKKDMAMQFISFASQRGPQAAITEFIPYGPINRQAFELIPETRKATLPTFPSNFAQQVVLNSAWWLEHEQEIEQRWDSWRLGVAKK
jgi:putative spermidine/putrescine transport system substrate-binding protein